MKYYLDTEFHEYKKKPLFGKPIDTIELISIGMVSEGITKTLMPPTDVYNETVTYSKEYYAICKDFDIKKAWNSWQPRTGQGDRNNIEPKEYWLRENVLIPIFDELIAKEFNAEYKANQVCCTTGYNPPVKFNIKNFKRLINKYGKTRKQIAEEIKAFTLQSFVGLKIDDEVIEDPEFYAYYADYDWVVFCWLFGRMVDLPKGFPMYCIDLKQIMDEKVSNMEFKKQLSGKPGDFVLVSGSINLQQSLDLVKGEGLVNGTYPKQTNEHNALSDAKFNKKLHYFLQNL